MGWSGSFIVIGKSINKRIRLGDIRSPVNGNVGDSIMVDLIFFLTFFILLNSAD